MIDRDFLIYAISEKYAQSEVAPQQRLAELGSEIKLLKRRLEDLPESPVVCGGSP